MKLTGSRKRWSLSYSSGANAIIAYGSACTCCRAVLCVRNDAGGAEDASTELFAGAPASTADERKCAPARAPGPITVSCLFCFVFASSICSSACLSSRRSDIAISGPGQRIQIFQELTPPPELLRTLLLLPPEENSPPHSSFSRSPPETCFRAPEHRTP